MSSTQNSYRKISKNVSTFINKIRRNGTKYNTKNEFLSLRRQQEQILTQLIKNSLGKTTFNAIANRVTLPSNKVVENMRRKNTARWEQQRKNLQSPRPTRRVNIPRGFI